VDKEIIKKPWSSPQLIQMEINETKNGGGYGLFDIAFQDTDDDEDLIS